MIKEAIAKLVDGQSLTRQEAVDAMHDLMTGEATPAQVGAFLTALRMKGETFEEIAGLADGMRAKAERVELDMALLDTCGTGGDGSGSLNVSTASAFVLSGAGVPVAKHGNRSMTSKCGSADVLEALGYKIDHGPAEVARLISETGFGFMFAQRFHPAMKFVGPVRQQLGVRTVFNILGPLTNPAGAKHQVLGVPNTAIAEKMAEALRMLGSVRSLVVSGDGGIDEISLSGTTVIFDVQQDGVTRSEFHPEDVGIRTAHARDIAGGDPLFNAGIIRDIFNGEKGPKRDVVVINAAAAFVASGRAPDMLQGVKEAEHAIDEGYARHALERAVLLSQQI